MAKGFVDTNDDKTDIRRKGDQQTVPISTESNIAHSLIKINISKYTDIENTTLFQVFREYFSLSTII
jgi:hypothetical protein